MRLIDADRLKTVMSETIMVIIRNPKMDNQEAHVMAAFDAFGKMLHNAPTIDAVSVVRCKDCRHWHGESENDATEECDGVIGNIRTTPDFFCAYGERNKVI